MPHIDPDAVALAALGEPLDPADRTHLAGCAECAQEVASLAAAAAVARAGGREPLVPAPAAVWDRIRAELDLPADLAPADVPGGTGVPGSVAGVPGAAGVPGSAAERPGGTGAPGSVAEMPGGTGVPVGAPAVSGVPEIPREAEPPSGAPAGGGSPAGPSPVRRWRRAWVAAAAAAGLVVGGVAGGLVVSALQRSGSETVVAQGQLDALPGWSATGDAVVEVDPDGRRTLVVRVEGDDADGFREVWLLDAEASQLVALGVLDGDEGRFVIPVGLDLARFPVVDVSAEPFDGDPAHSGDSIVRGTLATPA